MTQWYVCIDKPDLTFSASHFVVFGNQCEPLHGHDFRLSLQWHAPLDESGLVIDFLLLHRAAKSVIEQYDHRILLPGASARVELLVEGSRVQVACGERSWVFPQGDCLILPVANTTTELIAQSIGRRLVGQLAQEIRPGTAELQVELEECPGYRAVCQFRVP